MAILAARVNDNKHSTNPPDLMVLLDKVPHPEDMVYQIKTFSRNRTMYRSLAANGLVLYGIHNPDDQNGHGGAVFKIIDTDGVSHGFKGPWNSRASVMNKYFDRLPHIREVFITATPEHFGRGIMSTAYAMEVSTVNKWLSANKIGWLFISTNYEYAPDEPNYELQKVNENSPLVI